MATVLNPLMSADARGSVSSNTFSRNRSGNIVRNRTKPTNVNTPARAAVRSALSTVSQMWRTLTQAQRDAWELATANFPYLNKVGQVSLYSGQQLFMKFNQQLLVLGLATTETPPVPREFIELVQDAPPVFDIGSSATFTLGITPEVVPAGYQAVLQASAPVSAGVDSPASVSFKQINLIGGTSSLGDDQLNAYNAVYGSAPEGAKVWYRVKLVAENSGQSSPWLTGSVIVVDVT